MRAFFLVLLLFSNSVQADQLTPVSPFKKVVWIWLENIPYETMMDQRYIRNIWLNYRSARLSKVTQVSPVTQANSIAMISGNDFGIHDNELVRVFTPTIVNLLESKNIPWKVYAEQYPGSCYLNEGIGDYKRYRVPFLSISQIQTDRYLCSKVVGFKFLLDDLKFGSLPQFSIIIPSLKGSGATGGLNSAQSTLQDVLDPILSDAELLSETTVIISTTTNTSLKNPELFTMILGNGVANYAMTIDKPLNHYNILKTIEDGFSLGHLNQMDALAEPVLGIWK